MKKELWRPVRFSLLCMSFEATKPDMIQEKALMPAAMIVSGYAEKWR